MIFRVLGIQVTIDGPDEVHDSRRKLKGSGLHLKNHLITYLYCELEVQGESLGFDKGLKKARSEVKQLEITWIYNQPIQGVLLQSILKNRIAA